MGLFTRSGRAFGLSTGGYYGCGACGGSGTARCRNFGRKWTTTTGPCPMCSGKGGRFQNHAPIATASLRRMR